MNLRAVNQRYGNTSEPENEVVKLYFYHYAFCKIEQVFFHLCCLTYQMAEGDIVKTKLYKFLEKLETQIGYNIGFDYARKLNSEWEAKHDAI